MDANSGDCVCGFTLRREVLDVGCDGVRGRERRSGLYTRCLVHLGHPFWL